jgi:hypothetical protein
LERESTPIFVLCATKPNIMSTRKKSIRRFSKREDSYCIVDRAPKTAALLFDRVIVGLNNLECPDSIRFNPFTTDSSAEGREVELKFIFNGGEISVITKDLQNEEIKKTEAQNFDSAIQWTSNTVLRVMAEEIKEKLGVDAVPIYHSFSSFSNEYKAGDYGVVMAYLENFQVVDEEKMDWQQVLEFRTDEASVLNYRRMIHWLDGSMVGKSETLIHDTLSLKLQAYDVACKKHGFKTRLGTATDIIAATSAVGMAVFHQINGLWELAAGIGVPIATVIIKSVISSLDIKYSKKEAQGEIAYICELERRLN